MLTVRLKFAILSNPLKQHKYMSIKDENAEQAITEMNSKMFELNKQLADLVATKKAANADYNDQIKEIREEIKELLIERENMKSV